MDINTIVKRVNHYLTGEMLPYSVLEPFMDAVIDDINASLNSEFPTFGELSENTDYSGDTEYDYFPEKYVRNVVIKGTAYKFYIMDEEGMDTAERFNYDYEKALFEMIRDYSEQVPEEYMSDSTGSVETFEDFASLNGIAVLRNFNW